jgi:hypothetical protein
VQQPRTGGQCDVLILSPSTKGKLPATHNSSCRFSRQIEITSTLLMHDDNSLSAGFTALIPCPILLRREQQIMAVVGILWSISRQQNTRSSLSGLLLTRRNVRSMPIALPNTTRTRRRSQDTGDSQFTFTKAYISCAREVLLLGVSSAGRYMQLICIRLRMKSCLHGMI